MQDCRVTRLLPRLLYDDDLPAAELRAARIDGQVFAVDDGFAPVDEPDSMSLRAAALSRLVPDRMIAERSSALWVYGAHARSPFPHHLCIDMADRTPPLHTLRFVFREVRLEPVDVIELEGLKLTSPLRTAIDLLRTREEFGASDAREVTALLQVEATTVSECRERIRSQPRYPGVRRALARVSLMERCDGDLIPAEAELRSPRRRPPACADGQPALTR
jgi:hypothetical protein